MPEVTKLRVFFVLLISFVGVAAGMLAPPAHHYAPGTSAPPGLSFDTTDR